MNPLKNKKKVYTLMAGGFVTVSVLLAGISINEIRAFSNEGDSTNSIYGKLKSITIKDNTGETGSGSSERINEENLRDIIDNSNSNVKTTFLNEKDEKSMTFPYGLDKFDDPFESTFNTQNKIPNGGTADDIVPEYSNPNQNMDSSKNSFIDRNNISSGFLGISLGKSKEEVEDFHDIIVTKLDPIEGYAILYDYTTNIINIVNTLEDMAYRGVYLNNLVDSEEEETTIDFINEGSNNFKLEYETDELGNQSAILKATDGYNGHAELLVGGIPIIVSNDPSIEPMGESQPTEDYYPEQETDYTQDEYMQEDYDGTQDYPIFGDEMLDDEIYSEIGNPYEDYETGGDIWHNTGDFWGDDNIDIIGDTINPEGSPSPNNPIQDGGNSVDFGVDFDTDFDTESGTSSTNKKKPYKAVWGATEGSDHLKTNIKDRDEVLKNVKDRQSLNVVDIRGNSVDLVQKTKDTAPAQFKRELPVAVGEPGKNKDHMPFVKLMALLSFLSMIGSIISINLYYKEASREAKLKELEEVDLDLIKAQDFDELVGKDLDIAGILDLE